MRAGRIPPCARPDDAPTAASVKEVLVSLQKIRHLLGEYGLSDDQVTELTAMASSAIDPPQPFQWNRAQVETYLGRARGGPQVLYPKNATYKSLPFQVMDGRFYIVNPAADKEQEEQDDNDM
jgi:hypothetical protein